MGKDTTIQWADSTVNPTMGCDGCELWKPGVGGTCYAGVLHQRYGGTNKGFSPTFEQLTFYPGRMAKAAAWSDLSGTDRPDKPWLNGLPRVIFVSDMSDALSRAVSFDYLKAEIIDVVNSPKGRRHIWMWLTKQAPRMAMFSAWLAERGVSWPRNLWAGTSVTTQATVGRVLHLQQVGDGETTRFISAEPLRGPVALTWLGCIRLVIVGGGSGGEAPCDVSLIRSVIDQGRTGGAAVFVKQLGASPFDRTRSDIWFDGRIRHRNVPNDGPEATYARTVLGSELQPASLKLRDSHGGDWSEWPASLRIREFPAVEAPR